MNRRIIVCDDDMAIARAITMKLSRGGFAVETCYDGLAGWQAFQRERPELVITDLQMPRLDGLSLCRKIRESQDPVPLILLTAKGFELEEAALQEEFRDFQLFPKPFSPRELLTTVENTLAGTSGAANPG